MASRWRRVTLRCHRFFIAKVRMKIIKSQELSENPDLYKQLVRTLQNGGLVCMPCRGTYRILADLLNEDAVINLMQSKRRTSKAPSLVFIKDRSELKKVTDDVPALAEKLAKDHWPGPLTILFEPGTDIPRKVVKEICKANGHIGVRVPEDEALHRLLKEFGGPLLVSSANKEKKAGENSPAQIRKNFVSKVDHFVDAGDLATSGKSTIVEVQGNAITIKREGDITQETLQKYV